MGTTGQAGGALSARRVLMIVPFFPPMAGGGVYRPLAFVRYLSRYGWDPTVVAPSADAYWIRDERLLERVPPSVPVVRTPIWSGQALLAWMRGGRAHRAKRSSRGFGIARGAAAGILVPDSYVGWYPGAMRAARRLLCDGAYDAIYSTSPPETSHLIGRALHRHSGLPWVADFRDPWINLHLLRPPTPVHAALHRRLESSVCRHASVVVTTRWHEALLRDAYPEARVTRIANGYDAEEIDSLTTAAPTGDRFRIMHAGMLAQRRTVIPFLREVGRFLEKRPEARERLSVVFAGPREDANDRAVEELAMGDIVEFRGAMPHEDALREQKASHVLLLLKHDNPVYTGIVPGKLYEYIGLRRPILALGPSGEALDLVESLGRGETADSSQPGMVAERLERLYDHHRAGTLEKHYDLSEHPELDRSLLTGALAALLDRVATQ